jgi:hypothetical protein
MRKSALLAALRTELQQHDFPVSLTNRRQSRKAAGAQSLKDARSAEEVRNDASIPRPF